MNYFKTFIFIQLCLALVVFSYSGNERISYPERSIASSIPTVSAQEIDTLLTFKSLPLKSEHNLISLLINEHKHTGFQDLGITFIRADELLDKDSSYKILPRIHSGVYSIEVLYSERALHDHYAFVEVNQFLKSLTRHQYQTRYHFFELYYNAKKNHGVSIHNLAKIRKMAFNYRKTDSLSHNKLIEENRRDDVYWKNEIEKYSFIEKAQKSKAELEKKKRLELLKNFDDKKIQVQLRALAAQNDRKGVADLLQKLLPWEIMSPFEKKFYQNHLSYIRNPLPIEKRIFLYRGSDYNTFFPDATVPTNLSEEELAKNEKVFLTSHFLDFKDLKTKNFNSLHKTSFMVDPFNQHSNQFQRSTAISSYFYQHSESSFTSPFLSLTSDFGIATNFGRRKISLLAVDPRSVYYNYSTRHRNEIEFLMPFLSFPDEIVAVHRYDYVDFMTKNSPGGGQKLLHLLEEKYKTRLAKRMNPYEALDLIKKIKSNSAKELNFLNGKNNHPFMNPQFDRTIKEVIPNIPNYRYTLFTPVNKSCTDLIKEFYKK